MVTPRSNGPPLPDSESGDRRGTARESRRGLASLLRSSRPAIMSKQIRAMRVQPSRPIFNHRSVIHC
jgi:hypothetical protein